MRLTRVRGFLDLTASLAMLIAAGFIIYSYLRKQPSPERQIEVPSTPVSLEGATTKGSAHAPVAVLEFGDFECPACAFFARENGRKIDAEYVSTGRVLFAFRHLPLSIHPRAFAAAGIVQCAGRQGKFWEMHDAVYADNARLGKDDLLNLAERLHLSAPALEKCFTNSEALSDLKRDAAEAEKYGLAGTPSFFVGSLLPDGNLKVTNVLAGGIPFPEFRKLLDSALKAASKSRP